jgi:hypothetical protein
MESWCPVEIRINYSWNLRRVWVGRERIIVPESSDSWQGKLKNAHIHEILFTDKVLE